MPVVPTLAPWSLTAASLKMVKAEEEEEAAASMPLLTSLMPETPAELLSTVLQR